MTSDAAMFTVGSSILYLRMFSTASSSGSPMIAWRPSSVTALTEKFTAPTLSFASSRAFSAVSKFPFEYSTTRECGSFSLTNAIRSNRCGSRNGSPFKNNSTSCGCISTASLMIFLNKSTSIKPRLRFIVGTGQNTHLPLQWFVVSICSVPSVLILHFPLVPPLTSKEGAKASLRPLYAFLTASSVDDNADPALRVAGPGRLHREHAGLCHSRICHGLFCHDRSDNRSLGNACNRGRPVFQDDVAGRHV